MIVVDDIDSIPPRKILSVEVQPRARPAIKPEHIIPTITTNAVISAGPPTFINFLKLNSRPSENNRKMIPISAQMSTFPMFETPCNRKFPLHRNPATM